MELATISEVSRFYLLSRWVHDSEKYESNTWNDNGEYMGGLLEEHLNYVYHCHLNWPESDEHQIDLLFPIRLKNS